MYIIEGNIGAGKSTFLEILKEHLPEVTAITEPVASWDSQRHGPSVLQKFVEDTKRWSYTMETFTMMCRVKEHLYDQQRPEPSVVVERSIYSGHYVFACNGYQHGCMSHDEWHMYSAFFNYLIPGHCKPPRGFIYLRTDPYKAFARIQKRSRSSEHGISLEYIKQLHDRHDEFLLEKKDVLSDIKATPVLVLDCDQDFEHDKRRAAELVEQVKKFIC